MRAGFPRKTGSHFVYYQSNRCTNAFCSGVSVALRFQMRCALETISGLSMRFMTSVGSEFWIAEVYGAIATPMPDAAQLSEGGNVVVLADDVGDKAPDGGRRW